MATNKQPPRTTLGKHPIYLCMSFAKACTHSHLCNLHLTLVQVFVLRFFGFFFWCRGIESILSVQFTLSIKLWLQKLCRIIKFLCIEEDEIFLPLKAGFLTIPCYGVSFCINKIYDLSVISCRFLCALSIWNPIEFVTEYWGMIMRWLYPEGMEIN